MMTHPTAPDDHWKGPEGDAYQARQTLSLESRVAMFRRILFPDCSYQSPYGIMSVIEFGAGEGHNLDALRALSFGLYLTAVEINRAACEDAKTSADEVVCSSITGFRASKRWDLAFTRGVLIHIPPTDLCRAYEALYRASRRYILVAEYYNPKPVEIEYRGKMGLLWKRDFAGEMMGIYPNLKLRDYEFIYHREPEYPQDDVTWFLMEKT